jgi:phosphinothricin acetyltransferase
MSVVNTLTIREAANEDMEAVQSIYAFHVLHGLASFEETPPTTAEMIARRSAVAASGLPWLVAVREKRVLGYAYASTYRPRPAYRYTIEDSVYVEDGLAGQGIGAALLDDLLRRCETGRWRQMLAVIGNSENHGSIGLHRSRGFEPVGTFRNVGFKFGRWVDTVLMQRTLGPGALTLPPVVT